MVLGSVAYWAGCLGPGWATKMGRRQFSHGRRFVFVIRVIVVHQRSATAQREVELGGLGWGAAEREEGEKRSDDKIGKR